MKKLLVLITAMAFVVLGAGLAMAGEWHTGATNVCTDCHTMHFSMQHNWDGTTSVPTTPALGGNWMGATGPNAFLLKLPANDLCKACHDGQTFAPDVVATNTNSSPSQGRNAGALNELTSGAPYETWKGHTLGSQAVPPGYDPAKVGLSPTWYDNTVGLECIHCHTQHGSAGVYRNLGPRALSSTAKPSYVINTTNDTTRDVWINIAPPYTPNTGDAVTFNPFYANANVSYNRRDLTVGTTLTSNGIDTVCGACHGNFHGGPGNTEIGGTPAALDGFIRHPTAQTVIGAAGVQGYGGHSNLTRFVANTTKVKVYSNDRTAWADASPGCVSCHKAHGNQNPFGLIFLARGAASVNEEGGFGATQTQNQQVGYRNLCGQCHGQGADSTSATQPN